MPVVFLHGYGSTPADSIGPKLAAAFQRAGVALEITTPFVEPKQRRGDRIVQFAPTTLTFELAQIQRLADQSPGKLTLIGHSFGGLGARVYATLHPEKVERLILLSPGEGVARKVAQQNGIDAKSPEEIQARFGEILKEREALLAEAKAKGDDPGRIADLIEQINWLTMCSDIIGYDDAAPIRNLKVPTLLMRGMADDGLTRDQVWAVAWEAVDAKVTTLEVPGANHVLDGRTEADTKANFDVVAKAVASFLEVEAPAALTKDEFAARGAPAQKPEPYRPVPQAGDEKLFLK